MDGEDQLEWCGSRRDHNRVIYREHRECLRKLSSSPHTSIASLYIGHHQTPSSPCRHLLLLLSLSLHQETRNCLHLQAILSSFFREWIAKNSSPFRETVAAAGVQRRSSLQTTWDRRLPYLNTKTSPISFSSADTLQYNGWTKSIQDSLLFSVLSSRLLLFPI